MIECPNCRASNVPGSAVCYNCGTPLVAGPPATYSQALPPPATPTRRRWPLFAGVGALVAAVCCLLVLAVGGLAYSGAGPFARASTTVAPATPVVRATAALASATPIAVVLPTTIAVATVRLSTPAATPLPTTRPATSPSPPPATPTTSAPRVLLTENFDNALSGFGTESDSNLTRGYEGGNYVVRFKTTDAFFASGPAKPNYSDFQLDLDCTAATVVPTGACGVVFRWQDNAAGKGDSWYKFEVDPGTGSVRFDTLQNDVQVKNWLVWVPNPAVARGTNPNHLTVIANGPRIALLVNGQNVGTFDDATFTEGTIGIVAHGFTAPSEWHFANLKVTSIK